MRSVELRRGTSKAKIGTRKMVNYALRRIDPELWEAVKARADSEGRSVRWVLLQLLKLYAEHGYGVFEQMGNGSKRR